MNKFGIVSANAISREGLRRLVEDEEGFEVVASCDSTSSHDWSSLDDDVLVVLDGPAYLQRPTMVADLQDANPSLRCVVLTDLFDYDDMIECFRHGAQGYIVKDIECEPLVTSFKLIFMGQRVAPSHLIDALSGGSSVPTFASGMSQSFDKDLDSANLSTRELDVICCLMAGMPNKIIARRLALSEATVKVHVKAILRKLEVGNRTQAAIWASAHGIPQTEPLNGMAA